MAITIKNVLQASASGDSVATGSLGSASIGDLCVVMISNDVAGGTGTSVTDNAGNTYTKIAGRNAGPPNAGAAMYYSILTVANAALAVTVNETGVGTGGGITIVAWLVSGVTAYNNDQANAADFSGTSTAWSVGPTTPAPPAGSIFFYVGAAAATETGIADVAGWNTVGSNGFTSGMESNTKNSAFGAGSKPIWTGYLISGSVQTPAETLAAAALWFGVVASFSSSSTPATSYTMTGPTSGTVGVASSNFTLTPNGDATGIVVTPASSGAGSFSPATVTFSGSSPVTFTYTPSSTVGSPHAISVTNGGGLSNPANINYTVNPAVANAGYYYRQMLNP